MAYVPKIIDYKPFYIQTDVDEVAIDTREWGMVARTNPLPLFPAIKEPYKNKWLDEHGEDEYTLELYYEPIEFEVQFHVITMGDNAIETLVSQVESFRDKICSSQYKTYDSYTTVGRQNVRYVRGDIENFRERIRRGTNKASCDITVTFKANDPTTRVTLKEGKLVNV